MVRGDFELSKNEDGSYSVRHIPTNRVLGDMEKGWRGWISIPPTEHYGGGTQLETANAMLHEIDEFGVLASPEPDHCPYAKKYGCKEGPDCEEDCPLD